MTLIFTPPLIPINGRLNSDKVFSLVTLRNLPDIKSLLFRKLCSKPISRVVLRGIRRFCNWVISKS